MRVSNDSVEPTKIRGFSSVPALQREMLVRRFRTHTPLHCTVCLQLRQSRVAWDATLPWGAVLELYEMLPWLRRLAVQTLALT